MGQIAAPSAAPAAPRRTRWALVVAAVAGTGHGLFSLYWAVGGTWLVETLGEDIVETFADQLWLLLPVGVLKVGFAVLPLLLAESGRPISRVLRIVLWLGAVTLVVWGGLNTVVAHLVLAGVIQPTGGYDHQGMIGHAWIWDPLFLLWGVALVMGLRHPQPLRITPDRQ
ncbi:DUF3995 domain-containing protein [Ornithinimicrobium sp. LYQ92]|uniref:DUF3995 domain-containing protein n=1 Tax=Serinicoccus sp. LYQ92 TaxID=3378798 RepID=UPI003854F09E